RLLDLLDDLRGLLVRELVGRSQLDVQTPFLRGDEAFELASDLLDSADASFLRGQAEEVAHELVGVAQQLVEQLRLGPRIDLRVTQDRAQLRYLVDCGREVGELAVHALEAALLLRRLEQRTCVRAVDSAYRTTSLSSTEKSSSRIATLTRRR